MSMNQPHDVAAEEQPRIVVFDESPAKAGAFGSLARLPGVEVWCAAFPFPSSVTFDAIVSPANGFGFMDGGIDWAYSQFFGPGPEAREGDG